MDDQSMSLVATFALPHDAALARALLESAGIPTFLRNENITRLNIMQGMIEGGLQLLVPSSAEEDALEILNSRVSDKDLESQAE